jgi:hypothetical protein
VEVTIAIMMLGILLGAVYGFFRNVSILENQGVNNALQHRLLKQVEEQFTRDITNADTVFTGGGNQVRFYSLDREAGGPYYRYFFQSETLWRADGVSPVLLNARRIPVLPGVVTSGTDSSRISVLPLDSTGVSKLVTLHLVHQLDLDVRDVHDTDQRVLDLKCYNRQQ